MTDEEKAESTREAEEFMQQLNRNRIEAGEWQKLV